MPERVDGNHPETAILGDIGNLRESSDVCYYSNPNDDLPSGGETPLTCPSRTKAIIHHC